MSVEPEERMEKAASDTEVTFGAASPLLGDFPFTAESRSASYRTLPRICFFVAPTLFRIPNCRVRSLTEMEKEL